MVDVGHAALGCIVAYILGRADAADAAAIDLDEIDLAIVDNLPRHLLIVRRLAAGDFYRLRHSFERRILRQRSGVERFLQPGVKVPVR